VRWLTALRTAGAVDPDGSFRFASFVRGKRVAVVGPARTLLGSGSGDEIDRRDLVVRFNEAFEHVPIPGNWRGDVGQRCDVVYVNQVLLRQRLLERSAAERARIVRVAAEAGLRYLVCTNNSLGYRPDGRPAQACPGGDRTVPVRIARLLEASAPGVRLRMAHSASERAAGLLDGCYGRTGFIAILDLIGGGVSELFVTGMTFFHGGGHLLAPDAPPLRPDGNRDGSSSRDSNGRGHDSRRELEVFRAVVRAHPSTLRVDDALAKLLHYGPDLDERSHP
jgi:hypothetical protein